MQEPRVTRGLCRNGKVRNSPLGRLPEQVLKSYELSVMSCQLHIDNQ